MPNYFYTTLSPSQQILFGFQFCLAVIFRDISFSLSAGQRPIRTQQRFLVSSHWFALKLVCSSISCFFCFVASRSKRTVLFISRPLPLFFFTPLLYPQNVEIIQPNSALPWLAHLLSLGPAAPASRSLSEPRAARAAIPSGARSGDNGSPPAILAGEWIVTLTLCKFWTLGLERLKKLIQGGRKMPQQGRHPP